MGTYEMIDHVKTVMLALVESASMVVPDARKYDKAALDNINHLIFTSMELGVNHWKATQIGISDVPEELRPDVIDTCVPAYNTAKYMIDLSHRPGRIVIGSEDPEAFKNQIFRMLILLAKQCFLEGANLFPSSPPVPPPSQQPPPIPKNQPSLWILSLPFGAGCSLLSLWNSYYNVNSAFYSDIIFHFLFNLFVYTVVWVGLFWCLRGIYRYTTTR